MQISSVEDYSELFLLCGSPRIKFQLNSVHQLRQYISRLQQFFNILISSDFDRIPNLSFTMDVVYNGGNRLSIYFIIFEK